MNKTIFEDTNEFLSKFNLVTGHEKPHISPQMKIRLDHIQEELDETIDAVEDDDLLEVIDGLLDIIYVAAGTLNICGIDGQAHWDEIQRANMAKVRGVKSSRGHNFDVIKPKDWIEPNHEKVLNEYGNK